MTARVVLINEGGDAARAQALADDLALPRLERPDGFDLALTLTPARLELREVGTRTGAVYVEFVGGKAAHRRLNPGAEGLARALGVRGAFRPHVLDATAGLGRDAFVLASLGCRITLCERNAVVWALLEDGLERAREDAGVSAIAARMTLGRGDACEALGRLAPDAVDPDVVYLDPMYPPKKGAALPKKEMRLFHTLVGRDEDAGALLERARTQVRTVVKRPLDAEPLGGLRPSSSVKGKTTRWDVYLPTQG